MKLKAFLADLAKTTKNSFVWDMNSYGNIRSFKPDEASFPWADCPLTAVVRQNYGKRLSTSEAFEACKFLEISSKKSNAIQMAADSYNARTMSYHKRHEVIRKALLKACGLE